LNITNDGTKTFVITLNTNIHQIVKIATIANLWKRQCWQCWQCRHQNQQSAITHLL